MIYDFIKDLKQIYASKDNDEIQETGFGNLVFKKFYATVYTKSGRQFELKEEIPECDYKIICLLNQKTGQKAGFSPRDYKEHSYKDGVLKIKLQDNKKIRFII